VVKPFLSSKPNVPMPLSRRALARGRVHDRIVGVESAEHWASKQIEDL
jgi:hypothetical protein